MVGYVAASAAIIGPAASFVGGVFIGRTVPFIGTYHVPLGSGLALAVVTVRDVADRDLRAGADHQCAGPPASAARRAARRP